MNAAMTPHTGEPPSWNNRRVLAI